MVEQELVEVFDIFILDNHSPTLVLGEDGDNFGLEGKKFGIQRIGNGCIFGNEVVIEDAGDGGVAGWLNSINFYRLGEVLRNADQGATTTNRNEDTGNGGQLFEEFLANLGVAGVGNRIG